jgi:hypothetical protein
VDAFIDNAELDALVENAEEWVFHADSSDSDSSEMETTADTTIRTSKDGTDWHNEAERVGRRPALNILTEKPGFQKGLRPNSRLEAFHVVFDTLLDDAVLYTNLAGRRMAREKNIVWKKVSRMEMEAFLGLHMLAGVFKGHHRCLRELYDLKDGIPLFRAAMSEKRFEQLKACLRFDDPARRDPSDRGAPVRSIVDKFNERIARIYTPGGYLTIDEMLIEFHGRVCFKQYIPSKPGKFGIKVYWVTEANTGIPLKCVLYVGKSTVTDASREKYGGHVPALVMELMEPFLDCGRNVTMDNWFTSQKLANHLARRKTTLLGTLKSNSPSIPDYAKSLKRRERGDSVHFYSGTSTLCSFWDKGKKPVFILSTMHGTVSNRMAGDGKSELVKDYNVTKSGVDRLDKLVRGYSSKRKNRRWPCHVFFTLMDCCVYVAYNLMCQGETSESHYTFKKELAYELALPFVRSRAELSVLRGPVKDAMKMVGVNPIVQEMPQATGKRRCAFCPRDKDRKSKNTCASCGKHVCMEHQMLVCCECRRIDSPIVPV